MTDKETPDLHPTQQDVSFDLQQALAAIVSIQTQIAEDALTASILGTERAGHGIQIRENGLILTIGYLITEAETVWVIDHKKRAVPGHVVGYDQETGFGLVQALQRLDIPTLSLGSSALLDIGESVIVAGHGGIQQAIKARITAKQEFAGYWEYVLDEAIFTAPPHPNWGGAALIARDGTLCGIGSLLVQHSNDEDDPGGNMLVPIDILKPILDDLVMHGRVSRAPRPWLGMIATEIKGHLVIAGMVDGGPAQASDLNVGDLILQVDGVDVSELAEFFRRIWALGDAGIEVPLTIYRNGETLQIKVRSANRYDLLKAPHLH